MSSIYLLFNAYRRTVDAECTLQDREPMAVQVHNAFMKEKSKDRGIPVPEKLSQCKSERIRQEDDPNLFAKSFFAAFQRDGTYARLGCYWVKKEDYTGPKGEDLKALQLLLAAVEEDKQLKRKRDVTLPKAHEPSAKKPRIIPPSKKENTLPLSES